MKLADAVNNLESVGDDIQELLDESEDTEYLDTGEALELLQSARQAIADVIANW